MYGVAGARFRAAPVAKGAGDDQEGVRRPRRAAPPAVRTRGGFDDDDGGTARAVRARDAVLLPLAPAPDFFARTSPRERMNERIDAHPPA